MLAHPRRGRHLALGVVLAALLATVPLDGTDRSANAADGCTVAAEVRGTTCRGGGEGRLDGPGSPATYRVDILEPGASVGIVLASENESLKATLLDWKGNAVGQASPQNAAVPIAVPLPGVYGLRVEGDVPAGGSAYTVSTTVSYPRPDGKPAVQAAWPSALASGEGPIVGERQVIRVPRGGTPAAGVAASRILGIPPDGVFSDFTLVADVQFEKIVGPSALTVRFRYEPEAGGGTGYVLSVDPFAGTASLDTFEEGQRHTLVNDAPLGMMPTSDAPSRLVLTANGPAIRVTLDGQTIVEVRDGRFGRGLVAVGAVTWSDPVSVTFDHIQVTTPAR